ncbi:hypothetical protein FOQG_05102 [Fusarium oxysporum f. sp. raphani 54005]|uniref:Uncharacterized protein n=3 Tax=Fusarium oxysporum TaxID=5507 RepID=X0DHN9_FUSOX|nr:hypothetical protein FOQG_05102 [Fusarium oxysporum f. sp. raphani 54005]EXL87527.1 hypothetical protein FOPG_01211 [Fusarium oxysporum f. sp. conglutinans race 2 54008]EXM29422.1 hypothetical protein FOTG_05545 [Fusarium oxysporum f. sp. vasinfectum 25433]KAI8419186.1 hypothetical protein FOFC_01763 [Fusarium oxysporum]
MLSSMAQRSLQSAYLSSLAALVQIKDQFEFLVLHMLSLHRSTNMLAWTTVTDHVSVMRQTPTYPKQHRFTKER